LRIIFSFPPDFALTICLTTMMVTTLYTRHSSVY